MRGILLITENSRKLSPMHSALVRDGYRVAVSTPDEESIIDALGKITPEILIVDCRVNVKSAHEARKILRTECNLKEFLVFALLSLEQAQDMDWAGIDEFILEPYCSDELISRMKLLFWRTKNINGNQIIKVDNLMVDLQNYEVSVDDVSIELTFKEYELLKFLIIHRGRVFTRESLLDHVWGYDYYGGTRTVDVHIRRLRAKLGSISETMIETVRNVGYRFTV